MDYIKIPQLESYPLAQLQDEDLFEICFWNGTTFLTRKITGAVIKAAAGGGAVWGDITGNISNQSDLVAALAAKFNNPSGNATQYLDGSGTPTLFPTIPADQVNSDWDAVSGVAQILNKPSSLPPNGTAGGDLGGTYPNPSVFGIRGKIVNNGTPTNNQVLRFNSTSNQWEFVTLTQSNLGLNGLSGISDSNGVYTFYNSLAAAMAAATSGQVIEMFGNETTSSSTTIILKDNVNIQGNGYTYTNTGGFNALFSDGGGAVSCSILNLTVVRSINSSLSPNFDILGSGTIDFSGSRSIRNIASDSSSCFNVGGTATILNAIGSSQKNVVFRGTTPTSTFINCYGINLSSGGYCANIDGQFINSVALGTLSGALFLNGSGVATNCYIYSSSGKGIVGNGLVLNCTAISNTNYAGEFTGGEIRGSYFRSNSSSAVMNQGATYIACQFIGTLSYAVNSLNQTVRLFNCDAVCNWNNAAGHAVLSPLWVYQCRVSVANAAAYCLHSTLVINTKWGQNLFAGTATPVNPNITQTGGNEDNHGNIIF